MRAKVTFFLFFTSLNLVQSQTNCNSEREKQYFQNEVKQDIDFLVEKIYSSHVNPFSIKSKDEFDKEVTLIQNSINENATLSEILNYSKSILALLNDEHAEVYSKCIRDSLKSIIKNSTKTPASIISFELVKNYGFLKLNSFRTNKIYTIQDWETKIDSFFTIIQNSKIDTLIIDVSQNSGGNSKIGETVISYIFEAKYKGYGKKFKFSSDFKKTAQENGYYDESYDTLKEGEIISNKPYTKKPIIRTNNFKGKTYVLVSQNTFSSAIMFSTIVLDNNIATVVGEVPKKGHPNHFGEILKFTMPNSNLNFILSCKEWIRPSQKVQENKLIPNIEIEVEQKSEQEIVNQIKQHTSPN